MSSKASLNLMIDLLKDANLIGRNTQLLYRMSQGEHKSIGTFKKSSFLTDDESWFKKSFIILQ